MAGERPGFLKAGVAVLFTAKAYGRTGQCRGAALDDHRTGGCQIPYAVRCLVRRNAEADGCQPEYMESFGITMTPNVGPPPPLNRYMGCRSAANLAQWPCCLRHTEDHGGRQVQSIPVCRVHAVSHLSSTPVADSCFILYGKPAHGSSSQAWLPGVAWKGWIRIFTAALRHRCFIWRYAVMAIDSLP